MTTTATIGPSAPSPKIIAHTSAKTRPGVVSVSITQSPRNASHQRLRPIAIPTTVPSTNATANPIAMFFTVAREVREQLAGGDDAPRSPRRSRPAAGR